MYTVVLYVPTCEGVYGREGADHDGEEDVCVPAPEEALDEDTLDEDVEETELEDEIVEPPKGIGMEV